MPDPHGAHARFARRRRGSGDVWADAEGFGEHADAAGGSAHGGHHRPPHSPNAPARVPHPTAGQAHHGARAQPHWWPLFAAGRVYYSSVLDSLLAQAFFNPGMLRLLNQMLKPTPAAAGASSGSEGVVRGHIVQLPIPAGYSGSAYGELFEAMLAEGRVCLGLYREAGHQGCPLPYVYTNPTPESVVNAGDRIFALDANFAVGVANVAGPAPGRIAAGLPGVPAHAPPPGACGGAAGGAAAQPLAGSSWPGGGAPRYCASHPAHQPLL